jgi:adenylate cyclase
MADEAERKNGAARTADRRDPLRAAFAAESEVGLRLAARVRCVAAPIIAFWVSFENPWPEILFQYTFILAFTAIGLAPLWLRRRGRDAPWHDYLFPFLDMALLTLLLLLPNPLEADPPPPQMALSFRNEIYFFLFLASSVFSYAPRVVLWSGISAALCWSLGTLILFALPSSLGEPDPQLLTGLDTLQRAAVFLDPRRVYLGILIRQVLVFLITASALALFVARVRQLVAKHANSERQRNNLSRYFSANMVDELAELDEPLGATRQQDVAVLFADIVGFTTLSERMPPAEVIALLREFHALLERAVFAHQGTLDKYLGDGLMATFGTPRAGRRDATNALAGAIAMVAAIEQWNERRGAAGQAPLGIGIGVHYGAVVLGDIGGNGRLEFAVLGDTVNTASRLEALTRSAGTPLLVSEALVAAVRHEAADESLLATLVPHTAAELRGRSQSFRIWRYAPAGEKPQVHPS